MPQQNRVSGVATHIYSEVDGSIEIYYHDTCVVQFTPLKITLKTGGWYTNTTKTRMNQASSQFKLGYSVSQRKGNWYVAYKGREIPFAHGMILVR